jgi:hypothetical protein
MAQLRKQGIEDVGRGERSVDSRDGRLGSSDANASLIAGIVQALKGDGDAEARYGTVRLRPGEGYHD